MLDLSVIILAKNEELHIRRCLENILPAAKEVFVIDCFSTDNTAANNSELIGNIFFNKAPLHDGTNGPASTPRNSTGRWTTAPSPPPGFCAWTRTSGSCRKPWRS